MSHTQPALAEAVLDSLFAHVSVLDATGRIIAVNRAWRDFGGANGIAPDHRWEGVNYLDVCDASGGAAPEAADMAAGIRAVLCGDIPEFVLEYTCNAPREERWFIARVTRLPGPAPGTVLITHENTTTRKRYEQELQHQAFTDQLTGLPNRTWLHNWLNQLDQCDEPLSVLFLDVKRLKRVNDTLGYAGGDRLLAEIGRRLTRVLPGVSLSCRYGGGEFVVVLPGAGLDEALALADLITATLQAPFQVDRYELAPRIDIGIACREGNVHPEQVLSWADAARRKARGGNCCGRPVVYDGQMAAEACERIFLEEELVRGLDRGDFQVYYQPIVELRTGAVMGAEALLRWQHPERGLIPPDRFIPLAEETGCIHRLGRFVLFEACRQFAGWRGLGERFVSVNVSARQFLRPGFVDEVAAALAETGLPAERLQLELTESLVMQDVVQALQVMHAVRALGVRLALDDFGSGYSSLTYLKDFPLDVLKVDRGFTRGIGRDANTEAVIQAVLALGRALKMVVTVEGVETEQETSRLLAMGCERVQGYYFARPVPSAQFLDVLGSLEPRRC